MILTSKGEEVLSKVWNQFHDQLVEQEPGINENDIERAFLHVLLFGMKASDWKFDDEVYSLIDKIR